MFDISTPGSLFLFLPQAEEYCCGQWFFLIVYGSIHLSVSYLTVATQHQYIHIYIYIYTTLQAIMFHACDSYSVWNQSRTFPSKFCCQTTQFGYHGCQTCEAVKFKFIINLDNWNINPIFLSCKKSNCQINCCKWLPFLSSGQKNKCQTQKTWGMFSVSFSVQCVFWHFLSLWVFQCCALSIYEITFQ